MRFSVVIPTYNRRDLLNKTLQSVLSQDYAAGDYEVIVVDDGSMDGTDTMVSELQQQYRNLRFLRQQHRGCSAGRNKGIRAARGSYIACTDSDCEVPRDWLTRLAELFSEHSECVGVGGLQVPADLSSPVTRFFAKREQVLYGLCSKHAGDRTSYGLFGGPQVLSDKAVGQRRHLDSNNAAYHKAALESVGLFNEAILCGMDQDLGERLLANGYSLVHDPQLEVNHHERNSPGQLWGRGVYRGRGIYPHFARRGAGRRDLARLILEHGWRLVTFVCPLLWPFAAIHACCLWHRKRAFFQGVCRRDAVLFAIYLLLYDAGEGVGFFHGMSHYVRYMKRARSHITTLADTTPSAASHDGR